VFPGHQGGPHNHTITALAVALKQAKSPEFAKYQQQVLENCQTLANEFIKRGYKLVSGGTDNHLILIDLKPRGVDGARVERILELCNVALNKNTVPGDRSAMVPGGIRLGTPAVTTRGMKSADIMKVVEFVDRGVGIALEVQTATPNGAKAKFKDFQVALDSKSWPKLEQLCKEVVEFARKFPSVGF